MVEVSYLIIIVTFVIYYFCVLYFQRHILSDPKDIIEKFLAVVLLYAGISLMYFALTGQPLFSDNPEEYTVYIFIMGFVAVLWTIPTLLQEFTFFQQFIRRQDKEMKKLAKVAKKK